MKVLVTGDWHIGVSHYGVLDKDGKNSRLIDVEKSILSAIDIGIENNIDLFICTGDIFHTNRPTIDEQLVFWRILDRLSSNSCNFKSRFIIGNHDHNSKLGASHALKLFMEAFNHTGKVMIYDETAWEYFGDNELAVCFYPYHAAEPTYGGESDAYRTKALVCHSHLEGAVVGAEPFEIKSDHVTRFSQLPVDFVWAGHFHKPQVLSTSPVAFYPGSIHAVDFNERLDSKSVVICDTDTLMIDWVPVQYRKLTQIDIESDDGTINIDDDMLDGVVDSIVKVNVTMHERHVESFDDNAIRSIISNAGAHSIASINLNIIRPEVRRNPSIKLESDLKSNFELFLNDKEYGDLLDDVKKYGIQIIKQCGY